MKYPELKLTKEEREGLAALSWGDIKKIDRAWSSPDGFLFYVDIHWGRGIFLEYFFGSEIRDPLHEVKSDVIETGRVITVWKKAYDRYLETKTPDFQRSDFVSAHFSPYPGIEAANFSHVRSSSNDNSRFYREISSESKFPEGFNEVEILNLDKEVLECTFYRENQFPKDLQIVNFVYHKPSGTLCFSAAGESVPIFVNEYTKYELKQRSVDKERAGGSFIENLLLAPFSPECVFGQCMDF